MPLDERFFGPRVPALVQTARWIFNPIGFVKECVDRHGPVFRLRIAGWADHVIVGDPDLVRDLLAETRSGRLLTGQTNRLMAPVVSDRSIFLLDGTRHARVRRFLQQALRAEAIAQPGRIANQTVDALLSECPDTLDGNPITLVISGISLGIGSGLVGTATVIAVSRASNEDERDAAIGVCALTQDVGLASGALIVGFVIAAGGAMDFFAAGLTTTLAAALALMTAGRSMEAAEG